jgi:hypothetical protein
MNETPVTGRVRVFAEPDYRYGAGELRLVIEHIDRAHPQRYDGETWYEVRGTQVTEAGHPLGPRQVFIRADRLA